MTEPRALGVMDQPADWVECWQCKGEGRVGTCLAEPCPHRPPCPTKRCNVCAGNRGWLSSDVR